MNKKKISANQLSTKLFLSSAKIRGISHLIESQREPAAFPLDMKDVNYGISLILDD